MFISIVVRVLKAVFVTTEVHDAWGLAVAFGENINQEDQ